MSIKQTIHTYIVENFLFTDDESSLDDSTSFMAKGIIDSIGVQEIADFIAKTFDIKVNADELLPDNFDSVEKLVAFIERKRSMIDNVLL